MTNHSVLSKAKARWGSRAFKIFFDHIVWQYVQEGPIDGCKLFTDSSLIDADASNNSVAVNAKYEVITATKVTPGSVDDDMFLRKPWSYMNIAQKRK